MGSSEHASGLSPTRSVRVEPVGGGAEADHDRHVERERALHLVRDERGGDVADFRWIDGLILIDLFA